LYGDPKGTFAKIKLDFHVVYCAEVLGTLVFSPQRNGFKPDIYNSSINGTINVWKCCVKYKNKIYK